ncbi:hypothetical protein [Sphingomonas abietis]|uniref:Apea-like HEPN domain-containing protein n=1 Tax=Sphingomonas abietis TaxID=3012344 RepID=A0ABY7NM89_9SPHN|nr:hypothetical protein [Sphingomonas abietis]WBO21748.1 hypothetical protein PBT88_16475 [Sphingomonas abietis]
MKLEFHCWKCAKGTPGRRVTAPFNDSSVYRFECAQGHVYEIVLAQLRFEVLAETGMQALVDGYYRDAVASFAAALERVYQLYCEIVALSRDIDETVFKSTWKLVASQSERQLGMFIGLYMLENGDVPPQLPKKFVEFRNKVIHQGLFPAENDAVDFGQAVVNLVQPLLNSMMPRYTQEIEAFMIRHFENAEGAGRSDRNKHRVFFDFILQFDTEADDWDPAPADLSAELVARRSREIAD